MEGIWVRSNDKKTIIKTTCIDFRDEWETGDGDSKSKNAIIADIGDVEYLLGEYATKERAMQVMDEIDGHICRLEILKETSGTSTFGLPGLQPNNIIFEMPVE